MQSHRLSIYKRQVGINGHLYGALRALYKHTASCVRLKNIFQTEWFNVLCGLKQGCVLPPLLFNLFINELTEFN